MLSAGTPEKHRRLVPDQRAAPVGETEWLVTQEWHNYRLLVGPRRNSADVAAARSHAATNRVAALACGIGRPAAREKSGVASSGDGEVCEQSAGGIDQGARQLRLEGALPVAGSPAGLQTAEMCARARPWVYTALAQDGKLESRLTCSCHSVRAV